MIPEEFLKAVTADRGVSESEMEVLSQALHGSSIAAIANHLGIRPEAVRKRLGEVYKKFKIGGAGPGKMAKLQQILVSEYQHSQADNLFPTGGTHSGSLGSQERYDWGEAPDVSIFYGRSRPLATLQRWIVEENCRMVAILGMAGIGKTALSVKLAHQIAKEFDCVLWRSLRHAPPLKDLLDNLLKFLYFRHSGHPPNVNEKISHLLEYLRRYRCLLVLDSVDAVGQPGELAGHYRPGYEDYGDLFRRLGEEPHKSSLVMTSLDKPTEIGLLEGKTLPVRSFQLKDLNPEQARKILQAKGLYESKAWETPIELYRGNPLLLKIAATSIRELFDGNTALFLKHGTLVFGEIHALLDRQFQRLSELEKEILYWLAISRQPISLERLHEDMLLPVSVQELLEAVASLGRRSLLEKISDNEQAEFSVQPVVLEYVTQEFVARVCAELHEVFETKKPEKFVVFRSHALTQLEAKPEIQEEQQRWILKAIGDRLRRSFKSDSRIEGYLSQIDTLLQGEPPLEVGYASHNVKSLLGKKGELPEQG
ncbi:NB-ARC domain-containing protein [Phormidium sp. CCY1219]|uniref:NB-ARC domain-containing protein n=1 Tax=Phormidium sp. CCY1219 TaxID=2886104 RepID=UPI002D1F85EE|nr:NB-ARC domain-containing protein [Phormidium sp. CCY1219]MEB3829355.1 NACHT domain-containing protein [Phormidium sp. CCY1219]